MPMDSLRLIVLLMLPIELSGIGALEPEQSEMEAVNRVSELSYLAAFGWSKSGARACRLEKG